MAKPNYLELDGLKGPVRIPILYEDHAVMAIDKPAGWLLAPSSWRQTARNLQLAIESSIAKGDFWARSRNLKYLRFVHRLDSETSGVLLLAKSRGALSAYGRLFQLRQVEKIYLAVVRGRPKETEWVSRSPIRPLPRTNFGPGTTAERSKEAVTFFRVLQVRLDSPAGPLALVEARPQTGRTHQVRIHLAQAGCPVVGDRLYGLRPNGHKTGIMLQAETDLALRAVSIAYRDPFTQELIRIEAPSAQFIRQYGFAPSAKTALRLSTTPWE